MRYPTPIETKTISSQQNMMAPNISTIPQLQSEGKTLWLNGSNRKDPIFLPRLGRDLGQVEIKIIVWVPVKTSNRPVTSRKRWYPREYMSCKRSITSH